MKKLIKDKKPCKYGFSKILATLGVVFLLAVPQVGCQNNENSNTEHEQTQIEQVHELPSLEDSMNRLLDIYENKENIYLINDSINRLACPKDLENFNIYITFQVDKYRKIILQDNIDEINNVFKVVNPNYKFKLVFDYPPIEEKGNPYSILVKEMEMPYELFGMAFSEKIDKFEEIEGNEIYHGEIDLSDRIEDNKRFSHTFKHELCHLLGLGDAYKNSQTTKNTIMQNTTNVMNFTSYDVAFIDALYHSPKNFYTEEQMNDFIRNYETRNEINWGNTEFKLTEFKTKLEGIAQNLNLETLKKYVKESNTSLENKKEILSLVENGFEIDKDFGQTNIFFCDSPDSYSKTKEYKYFSIYGWQKNKEITTNLLTSKAIDQNKDILTFGDGVVMNNESCFFKIDKYVFSFNFKNENNLETNPDSIEIYKQTNKSLLDYFDSIYLDLTREK